MLAGRTVLIVEAQYIIGLDLQNSLETSGAGEIVLALDAAHAKEIAENWTDCALAIVEVERELSAHVQFVARLQSEGVPVIVITADAMLKHDRTWIGDTPILVKPVSAEQLAEAIARLRDTQNE